MTRRDPVTEIERFFDHMSDQFDRASQSIDEGALKFGGVSPGLDVDLLDTGDSYEVTVDVAGCEGEDVTVRVDDDTLHIDADFDDDRSVAGDEYVLHERTHRSIGRTVSLPGPVDVEGATASCTNGVLTVELPKDEPEADATSIEVS